MRRDSEGGAAAMQAALDALPHPAAVVDGRGVAHLWNGRAADALGWVAAGGAAGRAEPPRFARPDATWFARLRRAATEAGGPVAVTLRRRRAPERWVRCSAAPVFVAEAGGPAFLVTLRNVSTARTRARSLARTRRELKETEDQLRHAQKLEAVGLLAGGIAHDFRNLITAIRGHAELLVDDLGDDPRAEDAIHVQRAADRAAELTARLLAFSRREEEAGEVMDLNGMIRDMGGLLRRVIQEDIRLELALEPAPWSVRMAPSQAEQVLMNLVVNARDALPEGGVIHIRTANVEAEGMAGAGQPPLGPCAVLEVEDDGTGMEAAVVERIFEPFFTTKPAGKGTGLGLSTVYGIVRQAGGRVTVRSRPGGGTLFRVLLPRHDAA